MGRYACACCSIYTNVLCWHVSLGLSTENYGGAKVQDPYTLRCIPQVHGVVNDTLTFIREIITTEMNSALDNPVCMRV